MIETTMEILQAINQIAIDPAVRSGRAYITGTGVTVADVAMVKLYHQQDADGIADWYGLTLPQVYAALAYYYEHKTEIDQQIRTQLHKAEQYKRQHIHANSILSSGLFPSLACPGLS